MSNQKVVSQQAYIYDSMYFQINNKPGNATVYVAGKEVELRWDVTEQESKLKGCEYALG